MAARRRGSIKFGSLTPCPHQVLIHILHILISRLDQELFTGGTLLGSFRGPPTHTAVTPVEATSAKPSPRGHYVILQKDSTGLVGDNQQLNVADIVAFGRYGVGTEG